jgi:hypothetical protein
LTSSSLPPAESGSDSPESLATPGHRVHQVPPAGIRVSGGTRAGRSHRRRDVPCQDAFALWRQPDGARAAAAVADGLGSRPLSHFGSQAATRAAVDHLAQEPTWDEAALLRAFAAARAAVQAAADERGVPIVDLATTLQVATLDGGRVQAGMVGDGAIVCAGRANRHAASTAEMSPGDDGHAAPEPATGHDATVLLAPAEGGYANEVFPLTDPDWQAHLRLAQGDAWAVLLFTDGLTRLLLAKSRQGWQPFSPFFQAFLPRLAGPTFDDGLVAGFLEGESVDSSWDDDKGLVVLAHPGPLAPRPNPPAPPTTVPSTAGPGADSGTENREVDRPNLQGAHNA